VVRLAIPGFAGAPIRIRFRLRLSAHRGRLVSRLGKGRQVHAGSFLRKRVMVLDLELLQHPRELGRILAHELFHFAWLRLGNPARRSWEELLVREFQCRARGELGWSAEWRKQALGDADPCHRSRRWREYACESFCDSAAWLFAGGRRHDEFTLAKRWREARREWFQQALGAAAPLAV
jgi:hypothetical protein